MSAGMEAGWMSKALSVDLRERVLKSVAEGASHRTAASRCGVSAASVSRWRTLIEAAGASLLFLPPYSPDFNP